MGNLMQSLTESITKISRDEGRDFITGEEEVILSHNELIVKIMAYENGKSYLYALEDEHKLLEEQGSIVGMEFTGDIFYMIPCWDSLMSKLHAFHVACGPYE